MNAVSMTYAQWESAFRKYARCGLSTAVNQLLPVRGFSEDGQHSYLYF